MPTIARAALAHNGTVVVLNGASSAGKSSLARELQRLLPRPHLHVQLDAFRHMEPPAYFDHLAEGEAATRVAALCRSMNAAVAEFAAHGLDVLLDHVLTPEAWAYLHDDLAHVKVLLVGVHCAREELARRESTRADRKVGLSASQAAWIHEGRAYDFTVDTTGQSVAAVAGSVARWLASEPVPFAFARQRAPAAG